MKGQDMPEKPSPTFEAFAILELFGHQRIAGKITERQIAGAAFVQVDVPRATGETEYTRLFNPTAIYSISPVSEQIVMAFCQDYSNPPITAYELKSKFPELLKPDQPSLIDYKGMERIHDEDGEDEDQEDAEF